MPLPTQVQGGWKICCDPVTGRIWLIDSHGQPKLTGDDGLGHFRANLGPLTFLSSADAAELLRGFARILAAFSPGVSVGSPTVEGGTIRVAFKSRARTISADHKDHSAE